MRRVLLIAGLSLAAGAAPLGSAWAGPGGVWRVEDGTANVEIAPCGEALCGTVAWISKPELKDNKNPDISKRNRPVLGITVLQEMKAEGKNSWAGTIYNARDGSTYKAKMSMHGDNTLRVEGCIAGGMLCGGQDWSRVAQPTAAAAPSTAPVPQPADVAVAPQPGDIAVAPPPITQPGATVPLTSRRLETPEEARTTQPATTATPAQPPTQAAAPPIPAAAQPPPKQKTSKRTDPAGSDTPQITGDDAASAGRDAARMINKMLIDNGVSGTQISPDQAAAAARSATKIINQFLRDGGANGFR
jgi:uncharacterized protein (DUF2147 family)